MSNFRNSRLNGVARIIHTARHLHILKNLVTITQQYSLSDRLLKTLELEVYTVIICVLA